MCIFLLLCLAFAAATEASGEQDGDGSLAALWRGVLIAMAVACMLFVAYFIAIGRKLLMDEKKNIGKESSCKRALVRGLVVAVVLIGIIGALGLLLAFMSFGAMLVGIVYTLELDLVTSVVFIAANLLAAILWVYRTEVHAYILNRASAKPGKKQM